uniref:DNA-directed RNA polymerase subunit n=1 Tax=Glaukea argentea TaxID=2894057 RepID=A0A386B1H4_9CHLO|nr:RNA polymerase b-subunit [Udotea argentea]AYC65540.1 RNA polymerase b-subunit [Udotea argentea]
MTLTGFRLYIATSKMIRQWAQRQLPNGKKISGQILNSKTINYQTLKPEKDGLFCERLFGPVNDFICACGRPPSNQEQKFCPECEVEYISSRVRRYRLGYIQLTTAVAHIWFFRDNYFSLFLNLSKTKIESLLYCTQNISRTIFPKEIKNCNSNNLKKIFLRTFPSANLLDFSLKLSKFWYFEKKKHKIDKKTYSLTNQKIKYNSQIQSDRFLLFKKKSLWKNGGVRDLALYFGFSVISKMSSWQNNWFSLAFFLIKIPQKDDRLNKFYPGPPGLVNLCESQLFFGAQLIRTWLTQLIQYSCSDGKLLETQIRLNLAQLDYFKSISDDEFLYKIQLHRRLKYLRFFRYNQINPASMILSAIPVLPPELRPIMKLDNQVIISDFNKLYQNVIFRNKRLSQLALYKKNLNFNSISANILQYAQKSLQESVDSLIENGESSSKPLSDLFKGKKGRFRQNLLGKRVDYSGRSVIVVSPYLKIYECGLPRDIAYELFQPFLIRILICKNQTKTIFGAKEILSKKTKFIWNLLKEIAQRHPILLNRAPTLHRLNIQTFQPKLIDGKAILLHPLVCTAFNADFDGDQMGVHIPLCFQARAEAWKINWSQNNLFSVATHAPICFPSQDMILGSSFLTTRNVQFKNFAIWNNKVLFGFLKNCLFQKPFFLKTSKKFFYKEIRDILLSNISLIFFSKNLSRFINNKDFIWYLSNPYISGYETEKKMQKLIEIRLNFDGNFQKFRFEFCQQYHFSGAEMLRKIRTTYGRLKFYENLI